MSRHRRLKIAGYPLHLIQRGVNRCACSAGARDYELYLGLLEEMSRRHACEVHAYVLMTNHVHLLLTPTDPDGPSRLMKDLGQRYVQAYNRRHQRTGTLWEGRFKSSIVDSEAYLLRCQRYIEENPVRAGMVAHPSDYAWSSHRFNADGAANTFLVPHPLYLARIPFSCLTRSTLHWDRRRASDSRHTGSCSRRRQLPRKWKRSGSPATRACPSGVMCSFERSGGSSTEGLPSGRTAGLPRKPRTDLGFRQTETEVCPRFNYFSRCSTEARSSVSSFCVAAIFALAKSLSSRPFTISYFPPEHVTG